MKECGNALRIQGEIQQAECILQKWEHQTYSAIQKNHSLVQRALGKV